MDKSIKNINLSANFKLYEFIEGVAMSRPSVQMNWDAINAMDDAGKQAFVDRYTKMATLLQDARNLVNQNFRTRNNNIEIGLRITSGFRCIKWEVSKGRGSNSRHSLSAVDFFAHNVNDDALYAEVMEYLWKYFDEKLKGLGGVGTYKADAAQQLGNADFKKRPFRFIHIDNERSRATRWHYKAP